MMTVNLARHAVSEGSVVVCWVKYNCFIREVMRFQYPVLIRTSHDESNRRGRCPLLAGGRHAQSGAADGAGQRQQPAGAAGGVQQLRAVRLRYLPWFTDIKCQQIRGH